MGVNMGGEELSEGVWRALVASSFTNCSFHSQRAVAAHFRAKKCKMSFAFLYFFIATRLHSGGTL